MIYGKKSEKLPKEETPNAVLPKNADSNDSIKKVESKTAAVAWQFPMIDRVKFTNIIRRNRNVLVPVAASRSGLLILKQVSNLSTNRQD
jgi:hypothetical protein